MERKKAGWLRSSKTGRGKIWVFRGQRELEKTRNLSSSADRHGRLKWLEQKHAWQRKRGRGGVTQKGGTKRNDPGRWGRDSPFEFPMAKKRGELFLCTTGSD